MRWRSDRKVVYIFREKGYNRKKVRIQEGRKGAECMCSQNELNVLLKEIAAIYRKVFGDDIVKIVLYGHLYSFDQDQTAIDYNKASI